MLHCTLACKRFQQASEVVTFASNACYVGVAIKGQSKVQDRSCFTARQGKCMDLGSICGYVGIRVRVFHVLGSTRTNGRMCALVGFSSTRETSAFHIF